MALMNTLSKCTYMLHLYSLAAINLIQQETKRASSMMHIMMVDLKL